MNKGEAVARMKKPNKALRSDAAANQARIIQVAGAMFRDGHRPVTLDAVAKEAGVGIGTLYRHFPSREALAAAVYHREVDELVALATTVTNNSDNAAVALRMWMRATVEFVATKKGMADALSWSARMPAELTAYSSDRLTTVVDRLLIKATAEREAYVGVDAQDLLRVLVALCYEFDQPDWQMRVNSLLDIFLNGLLSSAS